MTNRNDITGDFITTGSVTKKYAEGWDRIFSKVPQHELNDLNTKLQAVGKLWAEHSYDPIWLENYFKNYNTTDNPTIDDIIRTFLGVK